MPPMAIPLAANQALVSWRPTWISCCSRWVRGVSGTVNTPWHVIPLFAKAVSQVAQLETVVQLQQAELTAAHTEIEAL